MTLKKPCGLESLPLKSSHTSEMKSSHYFHQALPRLHRVSESRVSSLLLRYQTLPYHFLYSNVVRKRSWQRAGLFSTRGSKLKVTCSLCLASTQANALVFLICACHSMLVRVIFAAGAVQAGTRQASNCQTLSGQLATERIA